MGATRKRCRKFWFEERPFGDTHVNQIVETIVEQDLRVKDHDHVDAEEHLEHVLVEIEVDRSLALRVGSREIEHDLFAFAPHRAFDLVGACAHAIIADIIFEADRFLANRHRNQRFHGAVVAGKQFLRRGYIDVITKARGHFNHPSRRNPARGDQCVEVRLAPIGLARLVHDELHQVFVILALFPDLDRRDAHPFFKDRMRFDRHRTDHLAADI